MFNNIYKNKRVLVTGHTGFKGSWLSIWLRELGADVVGYALEPPTQPNNFEACNLQSTVIDIRGDIRDLDHLLDIFNEYKPEFVFHLAAQPLVRLSYEEPKLTFDTNIGGTVNVLEAARQTKSVNVVVNITSDKCYENKEWIWGYRESDPMGGYDPYSASKGCAEIVFAAYLRSFFSQTSDRSLIGAASVRAGNVIGGGDWGKDRLVPDCIRALSAGKAIDIRNPHAVRPWQHVLEPLSGYLWLGALLSDQPERYSGPWNFGPEYSDHLTVSELVTKLIQSWGSGTWKDLSNPEAPHEASLLKLCCDKAHTYLGWQSVLATDSCLQMVTDWYKRFYTENQGPDMYTFCVSQINDYTNSATKKNCQWVK